MGRAIHGVEVGNSLKVLVERYGLGAKGTEVLDALGKRRDMFTPEELSRYGKYCINDVELTVALLGKLGKNFSEIEVDVVDITIRMFTEPVLMLELLMLEQHLENVKTNKEKLLLAATANKGDLMSNPKFAGLLEMLGIDPPMKTSLRTGKIAYAFAKTDEGMKELQTHADVRVQVLVAARLGNKTTLEETRTQRFIDIAKRGRMPVPLKYYAAHTGRWGGEDKINLQNLPARGESANKLKTAIRAPDGYRVIDSDSSQIEARVLAWFAGQDDLVKAFALGEDVYSIMAAYIYNKEVSKVTKAERFVGKTTILGCGYGMGDKRFRAQLKTFGVDIPETEAIRIIKAYRTTYTSIPKLWSNAQSALQTVFEKKAYNLGREGVVFFNYNEKGFQLPNDLWQKYDGLEQIQSPDGRTQYEYKTRKGMVKIYGGKVIENLCQALARCIIAEQMVQISKRYRVVLTVHDAIASVVREEEVDEARAYIETCMRTAPAWAKGLPLNCESGVGESYGEC
jgi:DNA polymerase